jgi:hypothetical protein
MAQETLEEAAEIGKFAEKKYLERLYSYQKVDFKDGVFEGAKWQSERMYSEEDLREAFNVAKHIGQKNIAYEFDEWFDKYKKIK